MKVLIVDDNSEMRRMMRLFLPASFDDIRDCADGINALSAYRDCLPDFVLMDWQMKQMDGLTATKEILKTFPKAFILSISQYDDAELQARAFEIGIRDFVSKDNLQKLREVLSCGAVE